ncbi:MAG: Nitroreductase, partial [uncultured Rubrobacteraceae bacterium]
DADPQRGGQDLLPPLPSRRPQLPPGPGARGGHGRHPGGRPLVGQRLQPPAVGDRGGPRTRDARRSRRRRGLREPLGRRASGYSPRDGGRAARAGDLRRRAPRRADHARRPCARRRLLYRLDRRCRQGRHKGPPRHTIRAHRADRDLPRLPGRDGPPPAHQRRSGPQTPLRDSPRGAIRL